MNDFQDTLKRLLEVDDPAAAPKLDPIGAPDNFNIATHEKGMGKSSDPGDVLKRHLEAQAFEFKKLKAAYDELVATVTQSLGDLGQYGIEDKDFMKGMKPMQKPVQKSIQGAVSDPSQVSSLTGVRNWRQGLNKPITAQTDDL